MEARICSRIVDTAFPCHGIQRKIRRAPPLLLGRANAFLRILSFWDMRSRTPVARMLSYLNIKYIFIFANLSFMFMKYEGKRQSLFLYCAIDFTPAHNRVDLFFY